MLVLGEVSLGLREGIVALPFALGALVAVRDDVNIAFPLGGLDLLLELLVLQDLFVRHDELHGSERVVWVHAFMAELFSRGCLLGKSSLVLTSAVRSLLLLLTCELKLLGLTLHRPLSNLPLLFLKFFDLFLDRLRLLGIRLDLGLDLRSLLLYWIRKLGLNDQALNLLSWSSCGLLFERLWHFRRLRGSRLLNCFLFWCYRRWGRFCLFRSDLSRLCGLLLRLRLLVYLSFIMFGLLFRFQTRCFFYLFNRTSHLTFGVITNAPVGF